MGVGAAAATQLESGRAALVAAKTIAGEAGSALKGLAGKLFGGKKK